MIGNPIYSSFRFYLPRGFIYDSVRSDIKTWYKATDLPYKDITDYLNGTIINAKIPGLVDQGTREQTKDGGKTSSYPSGLLLKSQIDKQLVVTFKLKNNYLNWIILYRQFLDWFERRDKAEEGNVFLPNVYMHFFDEEDNIIIEMIFKEVQIRQLADLDFRKQDNGIIARDFDLTLAFNDFDLKFNMDKGQSNRDDNLHVY